MESPDTGPHAAPRTAVIWQSLRAELERRGAGKGALAVLDVGGGTGGFAVPLARAGHRVTVVDASPDALAALLRRAAEAGVADRITAVQGDGDRLTESVPPRSADLALCHSLLEIVPEPSDVVDGLAAALRPGGAASVLVANRAAAVLGRALGGHLSDAYAILDDEAGRAGARDTLRRRFDVDSAAALLNTGGFTVEAVHGVRVLADLVPADADPALVLAFELAAAQRPPYRDIATQLHLLARRT